jgi:HlyD family secretion protein
VGDCGCATEITSEELPMRILGLVLLIAVLGASGAYYYKTRASETAAVHFRTVPVQRGDLLSTISATGTIEPEEVVDVGAQVMGRILDLGIDFDAAKTNGLPEPEPTQPKPDADITVAHFRPSTEPRGVSTDGNAPRSTNGSAAHKQAADKRPRIDYGSIVHVGTELAYIDDTRYKAQYLQAEAAVERAIADLAQLEAKAFQAAAELQRAEELRHGERTGKTLPEVPIIAISKSNYDLAVANDKVAKANLAVGKAMVKQNQAALTQAQTDLDYTIIKSPVEGVIVDRRVNIGQTVVAALNAPSLFLIAKDLSRLQVWASVNEADIGRIRKGMRVQFTVDAYPRENFAGRVKQVRLNAQMTQNVVTYTVVVETDNPDGKLLPYLTANVRFEVEHRSGVLLVPNAVLRWKPKASQIDPAIDVSTLPAESPDTEARGRVWVLTDNGLARPLDVTVGASDDLLTEISGDGVTEGMQVIAGGQVRLGADAGDEEEADKPGPGDEEQSKNPFLPKPPKGAKPPPGSM